MARERYLKELDEETKRKNEYEQKIRELESKENELIENLQNVNNMEIQAMERLQKIMTGEAVDLFEDSGNELNSMVDESLRGSNVCQKEDFKF